MSPARQRCREQELEVFAAAEGQELRFIESDAETRQRLARRSQRRRLVRIPFSLPMMTQTILRLLTLALEQDRIPHRDRK